MRSTEQFIQNSMVSFSVHTFVFHSARKLSVFRWVFGYGQYPRANLSSPRYMLYTETHTNSTPRQLCTFNFLHIIQTTANPTNKRATFLWNTTAESVTANPTYSDLPITLNEYGKNCVILMEGKQRCILVNNMIHILNPYSRKQGVTARSYQRDEVVTFSSTRRLLFEVSSIKCLLSFPAE
jgi:hypothetical protein